MNFNHFQERCNKYHNDNVQLQNDLTRAKRLSFVSQSSQDLNMSFTENASTSVTSASSPSSASPDSSRKKQLTNVDSKSKNVSISFFEKYF